MKLTISEISQYAIEADSESDAISKLKSGEVKPFHQTHVINGIVHTTSQVAVPKDQWPVWAKVLAAKSIPTDKGVGDVVARLIGPEISEKFKAFYIVTFGKPCGCDGRQAEWNRRYPLK